MFSRQIQNIISNYQAENAGILTNLVDILNHGKLAGTGKLLILPVDQGFEHGPDASFAKNIDAYDPSYHHKFAIESGVSAYAAPLGMLELTATKYPGLVPLILKMNSNNILQNNNDPKQAMTASVEDALRLGCSAVGFTIYPGADSALSSYEFISQQITKAKQAGLVVVIWAYPRGAGVTKNYESAIDVIAYAAHIACLLGGHIVKVKLPEHKFLNKEIEKYYYSNNQNFNSLEHRIKHIKQSCFSGKRIILFSGGSSKNLSQILFETKAIASAGANGSIIGRNCFQRSKNEALAMLKQISEIYKN